MATRLKIITYNANSVNNQRQELIDMIINNTPDLVLLQETYLKPRHRLAVPNYVTYRTDRETRGGGTAILVKRTIMHTEIQRKYKEGIEGTGVRIFTSTTPIDIWSIYIPPGINIYINALKDLLNHDAHFLIAGDLNAKSQAWGCISGNSRGETLRTILNSNEELLVMAPREHTHIDTRGATDILDIGITNISTVTTTRVLPQVISDHLPVEFRISTKFNQHHHTPQKKYNWKVFQNQLHRLQKKPLPPLVDEQIINQAAETIEGEIKDALEAAEVRSQTQTCPINHLNPLPPEIKTLIAKRNRLRVIHKETKHPRTKTAINNLEKQIKALIKEFKENEWNKFIRKILDKSDSP